MTQTDVDKLMPRINLSTVMTGLVLALLGFGGQQVWNLNAQIAEIRQTLAVQAETAKIQYEAIRGFASTYYTADAARADWRVQERENAQMRAQNEALAERVRALENASRRPSPEHPR